MMRVLVTGVAGFIGAAVARALIARGDYVLGIDSLNDYYSPALKRARLATLDGPSFAFNHVDFADDAALDSALERENFDRIVHLGAQPGVRYSIQNPRAYFRANLAGHLNVLEIARARRIVHMVYASSSSVYGTTGTVPFSVDNRVDHPVSLYAATKKSDELISETYAHLYRLPLTGLRFFTVYGPWGRPDMAAWIFTASILAGEPIPVFNHGKLRRDFTYIDDIVAGILAVLDHPPADDGQIKDGGSIAPHALYNIGNHRAEALDDFIAAIAAACGTEAICDFQPMQPGDVYETYADIAPMQRNFGYAPRTNINVGIPAFVSWYRTYHNV
jgi:UDP-glucuronate 4-epimerase